MPKVVIVTGPPGSGKTTITNSLAEKVKKGAVINVDDIRHIIKAGYVQPWLNVREAKEQKKLAILNACNLAINFLKSGIDIFIDDVVVSEDSVKLYKKLFAGNKIHFFLLLPSKDVLIKRDISRDEGTMGKRAIELYDIFKAAKNKLDWYIIDNTFLTIKETTDKIMAKI